MIKTSVLSLFEQCADIYPTGIGLDDVTHSFTLHLMCADKVFRNEEIIVIDRDHGRATAFVGEEDTDIPALDRVPQKMFF